MSSSLVLSGPSASAIVDRRWIAFSLNKTSSCCRRVSLFTSNHARYSGVYLELVDQYRDGKQLVVLILAFHDCSVCSVI